MNLLKKDKEDKDDKEDKEQDSVGSEDQNLLKVIQAKQKEEQQVHHQMGKLKEKMHLWLIEIVKNIN